MKKKSIGIFCLVLGLFLLGGCRKAKPESMINQQSDSSESVLVESSMSGVTESSMTTGELSESEDSSLFNRMIEAAQSQLPAMKEQYGETYQDMTITAGVDHTVVYTCTVSQQAASRVDLEALKPTLIKGMKPVMDSAKSVIPDIKIQVIYLNPDGSEIGNFTITQEDTAAIGEAA